MRIEEAEFISAALAELPEGALQPVLELGSSSLAFRTFDKPYIDALIHKPLLARGVRVITSDVKEGPGIEVSGDLYSAQTQAALRALNPACILCCNLLEHLTDPATFAQSCSDLLPADGLLVVSVPYSYPYHPDPIDTMYRPTPEEIVDLFPAFVLERAQVVTSGTYWDDLRRTGRPYVELGITLVRLLKVWDGHRWRARAHRLLWLRRSYAVSVAILRKKS